MLSKELEVIKLGILEVCTASYLHASISVSLLLCFLQTAILAISYIKSEQMLAVQNMYLVKWFCSLVGLTLDTTSKNALCHNGINMTAHHCHTWTVQLTILQFLSHYRHTLDPSILARPSNFQLTSRLMQSHLHNVWLCHLNSALQVNHPHSLHSNR